MSKDRPIEPANLTVREAARYLGVSPATLNAWRSRGTGPEYLKLGGKVFYPVRLLDAYCDAHIVRPGAGDSK